MVAFSNLLITFSAVSASLATRNSILPKRSPMDFILQHNQSPLNDRATIYQKYYKTGEDVLCIPSDSSFTVDWSTEDDFVVGLGWTTETTNPLNFSGTFGMGSGRSEDSLVEYYIIEASASPPSFRTIRGSVASNGSSYTIWENQRVMSRLLWERLLLISIFRRNLLSAKLVRLSPRKRGNVTADNHFQARTALSMNLGSLNYQILVVEG
ncbi:hypothetical protein BELL_0639g00030 [Botrytis elliptica]|uniref:endo-1,4-beta-xylanase n=1 Tax=Botrytis elliptica TaxID=278938 RepID=A0A4Z1JNR3_9HELO|nr:hypothetical protein EAE99_002355 [Botrytis elliptica]TGO70963.1 hypothetical protein BELL_0639g00030 [Botrytis elliptica]